MRALSAAIVLLLGLAATPSSTAQAAAPVVLGRFTTTYATDAEHKSRAFNVELTAEAIDNKTIAANGGVLSFNDAVGERTAAFGFEKAAVIRDGMMAEGMGGGACQVASTLHAAALLSGIEITSRAPHTRPSAYIRMGLDATVAFGNAAAAAGAAGSAAIDLKIKNPTSAPIVVHARAAKGSLEVWLDSVGGTKLDVRLTSEIIERTPFTRVLERDKNLDKQASPDTSAHVKQFGIPGYKIRRTREIRVPGRGAVTGDQPPRTGDGNSNSNSNSNGDSDASTVKRDMRIDTYNPIAQQLRVAQSFDESRFSIPWSSSSASSSSSSSSSAANTQPWQPMDEDDQPKESVIFTPDPHAMRPALVQLRPSTTVTIDNH